MSKLQNLAPEVYIGRQPIFDVNLNVYAYELLFRSNATTNQSNISNNDLDKGDIATTQLILNIFSDLGFTEVVGNKIAFINITSNLLFNLPPLQKDKVVLEILENVEINSKVINAALLLKEQGYTIALDDFIFNEQWIPLIELSDIIKIDISCYSEQQLIEQIQILKPFGKRILAEKLETHQELELCTNLGCELFQGFFLSKPKIISGKRVATNKVMILQLITHLNDPMISAQEIENLICRDVKLTYKLLQIINSAAFVKVNKIVSLKQAIVYLGITQLKKWVNLIALNSIQDKPHELMITTMIRAKMCELIAKGQQASDPGVFFIVGLLSTIDALLDDKMQNLLIKLPLDQNIQNALLSRAGPMGKVLSDVISYEKGEWDDLIEQNPQQHAIKSVDYTIAYLDSIEWVNEAYKSLRDA